MKFNVDLGKINAEIEGDSIRDVFQNIAQVQEVFGENVCGKCGGDDLKFVVRTVDDNQYYEIRCKTCGAKLSFGANKKGGGLFPKRKDADGSWLPDNGWVKWNPKTNSNE